MQAGESLLARVWKEKISAPRNYPKQISLYLGQYQKNN